MSLALVDRQRYLWMNGGNWRSTIHVKVCVTLLLLLAVPDPLDNGLRSLGMVKKLGQWLPHEQPDDNRRRRLDICTQLLSRSRTFNWLDTIVTEDEKWVLYVTSLVNMRDANTMKCRNLS
ncbi:unnamed protein product [Heligmosomoides polygyrus]|uniref:Neur_chan_LBD domain-containing protein n=1 Tax=Heligmosomoides polygyrus TaxID=6339 RepID=A0A183FRC0_HELPZ|nr:unnamed protein product [Heligmosomoides polygyrus]